MTDGKTELLIELRVRDYKEGGNGREGLGYEVGEVNLLVSSLYVSKLETPVIILA